VKEGYVKPHAEARLKHRAGALEQWDGCLGPGPLNALFSTRRAMALAKESGIGCVAVSNTNHWMRGGYYGWEAAKSGFVFIGWTNTIANMPAWGAVDPRLGNNPIVLAVPFEAEAIVLDMAMSQFSYGSVELHQLRGKELPLPGGYDAKGSLTTDPSAILGSKRLLPMGYWKGSGLAVLLDILAAVLSGGQSTNQISPREEEYAVSQVFVAIDLSQLGNQSSIRSAIQAVIDDLHASIASPDVSDVMYPGERILKTRNENLSKGVPVDKSIWEAVRNL
jgi:3-dehydro-L-gulonate 2-dehydrogenase